MAEAARTAAERKANTLALLEREIDCWVATADPSAGVPYLVPLSFWWDGENLLLATAAAARTARNLVANGRVRLGIGPTRDLVLIEGSVEAIEDDAITAAAGDAFAAKTGFDPRRLTGHYQYFRVRPERIQAWREANEIAGRDLMRGGVWLVD
jgi:nitroimidazol reductase NimA-like FMN-containing flavoprotein (pyridoxamine 5'-phosphate oxidase superfamily)